MARAGIVVAATLAVAAPAGATPLTTAESSQFQQWADGSLMPTPSRRIQLQLTGCVSLTGSWSCALSTGVISIAPRDAGDRGVFLHELGHMVDFFMARPRDRRAYRRIIGLRPSMRWRSQPVGGQELWATSWSLCARYAVLPDDYTTQYGFRPSDAIHQASCRLFARLPRARSGR
jgi:hypothetical protein